MANRFVLPLETPVDATGAPYPGGKLFFYVNTTATKQDTYSNPGLTIANTNPVVLDSAGRFPNAIFLSNVPYTVVLAPSTDSDPPTAPIWTQDNVYASDYSTAAQFRSGSGSPNGSVAGNAGSVTVLASSYWDFTNNILYICTTTGSTSTAVWTAINAATAAAVVPAPQGYLTPVSNTPIITADSTAATTVYYTPYQGLLVPIYNGVSMVPTSIVSELQLTLVSSHAASNIYDFYIFLLNGVATLGTGPSWSAGSGGSITAGSCARGTGAGGAALSMVQGYFTNTVSMTMRYGNGTTTTTVAANQGTYVGSMFMDGTNGQVTCNRSYGQSRKFGIWNAFNQNQINLLVGDSTASHTYASATYRPFNNATTNSAQPLCGLPINTISARYDQYGGGSGGAVNFASAIGINSTTAVSGIPGTGQSPINLNTSVSAAVLLSPSLGINTFTQLESVNSGTCAYGGTQTNCRMVVQYLG